MDTLIRLLEDYLKRNKEKLISATRNNTYNIKSNKTITRKQEFEENQLYEYFKWQPGNIWHEKTWTCLRKGNFKSETESFLIAAQNDAIWS